MKNNFIQGRDYLFQSKLCNPHNPTCCKWGYDELHMKYNNAVIKKDDDNYFMTREQIQNLGLTNVDGGEPEYLEDGVWITESVKLNDFAVSTEFLRDTILKAIMLLQYLHNHYLFMDIDYIKWFTIKLYDIHQSLLPSNKANDMSFFQDYICNYDENGVRLDILNEIVGLSENDRNRLLEKFKEIEAKFFDTKTISIYGIEYDQGFIASILSMAADYYIITVFSDFDENEYTIADAINLSSACLLYCIGFNLKGESVENACQKTFEHLDCNITPTSLDEIQEACFDMVVR